jgi:hypothetical protein
MTAFLVILFLFGVAVIIYAVVLFVVSMRSLKNSVSANLAISRAALMVDSRQREEKEAQVKEAREASKVLSPLSLSGASVMAAQRARPKWGDPLAVFDPGALGERVQLQG